MRGGGGFGFIYDGVGVVEVYLSARVFELAK